MKCVVPALAMIACQSHAPEPTKPRPHEVAAVAAAKSIDAPEKLDPPGPPVTIASWSSTPNQLASPACIIGGNDRFIQYADDAESGALRFCLWWNVDKTGNSDAGCWRVDLATGDYAGQGGVWFSSRQPQRVGFGGGAGASAADANATWHDDGVDVCRGTACKRVALTKPADAEAHDFAFDAAGSLAVVPLGPGAKARVFATIDMATGKQVATLTIANRHDGAEAVGFLGSALVVTDCDDRGDHCAWDLYDPHSGKRIAAVGGASPLGSGGTAVTLDAQRFAAVAGAHLVVQTTTGAVTASVELPRPPKIHSEYVAFAHDASLAMLGPDGRVVFVDPTTGSIIRTIMPPACKRRG